MQYEGRDVELKVDDANICYDDLGKSEVPLIFIHGFPFNKEMWKPQVDFFSKTRRVIAFDLRGYGKSDLGHQKLSIELFADDLITFMDILRIDQAVVCGLSMGGYILLNAVNRYANRFRAIVLADTQCVADTAEGKEKRMNTVRQIEETGLKIFTEGFVKNVFSKYTHENNKDAVNKIEKIILSAKPEVVQGTLIALANRYETCSILGEIKIPALIICGKDDIITPPGQSEFMNKNISSSKIEMIDNAGHLSNLEQPEIFNNLLENFLRMGDF